MALYYGLYSNKRKCVMGFNVCSNGDAEFSSDIEVVLSQHSEVWTPLWLTPSRVVAERAARKPSEWYNAGYETPTWDVAYYGKELEVIEITVEFKLP